MVPRSSTPLERLDKTAERLHAVAIHLLRRLRRVDAASGLSAPRLSALSVVVFGGPATVSELAAAEQVRVPTMSRLVAALEELGYLRREADSRDLRCVRVSATEVGRKVMMAGRARRVLLLTDWLSRASASERSSIQRSLAVLERIVREAG